jgi:hypothetical protein
MARLTNMTKVRSAAVLTLLALGLLGACARGTNGGEAAAPAGSDVVSTAPESTGPGTTATPPPTESPSAPGGPVGSASPGDLTLTGQVEQGVEPGCLIMRSGGKTYELTSVNHSVVYAGAVVVVTGHIVTGMMSHCQQGPIFQVTSARPA